MTLADLIDFLQEQAESFEAAGEEEVFQILDTAADRLREVLRKDLK